MVVILCCFAIMLCDGYDLTVIAFAMPVIGLEWHVATSGFGYVFSASVVGVMIGAPVSGKLADRFGRKRILLCCVFTFALAVALTGLTETFSQLIAARFASGLGLGGVIPLSIALVGEQSPSRHRATLISIATTGMTIGAGLPALAATVLLPTLGWRSLFWVGGATPFAIGIVSLLVLPESREFTRVRSLLETRDERPKLKAIVAGKFASFTPLLWGSFAAIGFVSYFIQSWTPSLYLGLGRPLGEVAFSVSMFQVGGAVGGLLVGWVMDRFGPRCIPLLFILASPGVAVLGYPQSIPILLPYLLGVCGFLILALQLAANALAAIAYPTSIRALGIGFGLGSARLGQILGTLVGANLIGEGIGLPAIFGVLSAVFLFGAIVSYPLAFEGRRKSAEKALR
jgi:AAHS family 4-hydroxybenzoate transporter-like MFS transporter